MNYFNKIRYAICTTEDMTFSMMIDRLLFQIPEEETVLRLSFFGSLESNLQYVEQKKLLEQKIKERFGLSLPVWSYIAQPPLNASLILEVTSFLPEPEDAIHFRLIDTLPYVLIENAKGRFLFAGGIQGNVLEDTQKDQADHIFSSIEKLLDAEDFRIHDIVRQWNYIERITGYENGGQHYQLFNNSRSAFYAKTEWLNGYPAATGIGTAFGGVLVDFDAVVLKRQEGFITPIDNKLQIAAHLYSDQVLEVAHRQKTTPKFERAKSLTMGEHRFIYISGTAAIRGENSLKGVGLAKQLRITMENIAELTGKARPLLYRVYLKYSEDYNEAFHLMQAYGYDIPIFYVCADVCRDDLLIEIEGIAIE